MAGAKAWAASSKSRKEKAAKKFWDVFNAKHAGTLTLPGFVYASALEPITALCKYHGEFSTKPTYLVSGYGCPACGRQASADKRASSKELFKAKARVVHGDKYDYSQSVYVTSKTLLSIRCPQHGIFEQKPNSHLSGRGCPECAKETRKTKRLSKSLQLVKQQVAKKHPGLEVDWSHYDGWHKPIPVRCLKHGTVFPSPANLAHSNPCRKCGDESSAQLRQHTTDSWVAAARKVHGDKYDYSETKYTGSEDRTRVLCRKHGPFLTTNDHLHDSTGCPICGHSLSKAEQEIADFLSLFTTVVQRDRSIIGPKELDIYLPELNLAIEYCGMYWHSHRNQEDEKKNKRKHAEKHRLCAEKGIRLITIFETEWLERPQTIRRLLRAATGNLRGRLMARKCELRSVSNAEARSFYDKYHPQGGNGHGTHYALFWKDKMVACMRFTLGGNDRGYGAKDRQWTLSRYATRLSVAGAAGRLFKAFIKDHQPDSVKSFSDNRLFSGGMYEQLGFALEENVGADYQVWSPKIGLRPKPHYQRRQIPKRLKDHGVENQFDPKTDPRTEAEMTYLVGAGRIYDCGKKRWLWTPPQ